MANPICTYEMRTVIWHPTKGTKLQFWAFRWRKGEENRVINKILEYKQREDLDFDIYDCTRAIANVISAGATVT